MNIGLLFGGRSYEHDISVITALEAASALSVEHTVYPIYAKDGEFYWIKGKIKLSDFAEKREKKKKVEWFADGARKGIRKGRKKIPLDSVVCCCHGGEGEDGHFSALLDVYSIPYTASAPLPSALVMDKRYAKILFSHFGFISPKAIFASRGEDAIEKAKELSYPLIVKPSSLGSSIGIAVAHDEKELIESVGVAFEFDETILIEEYVKDAVELNCAAFSEEGKIVTSAVETPKSWHEFLTFQDKYEGGKYKNGSQKFVKGEMEERVRKQTEKIYRAFSLFGIARIDFLYDEQNDRLFVNEINSQPGSLAYYLFEEEGISFPDLIERVIVESIRREKEKGIIKFNSGVLDNLSVKCVK